MKSLSLILICALIGIAAAGHTWTKTGEEVLDNYHVTFKVAMMPQNAETLKSLWLEISNPKSPFFGEFLTNEQIADLISLPEENIQEVEAFLTAKSGEICNVHTRRSVTRDYIFVDTCAAQAQLIFPNLRLAVYQESEGHKELRNEILVDINSNLYLLGVPQNLHQYIQGVHDLTDTPVIAHRRAAQYHSGEAWEPSDKELTVGDMIKYFGMDYSDVSAATLAADHPQVRAAVVEFGGAAFSASELKQFQAKYDIPNDPIRKVIGSEETFEESVEASLDVQTITSIGKNLQVWDFVFGNNFDFVPVVDKLLSTEGAPRVISLSYGEPETVFGKSKVEANNTAFQKLGLAGYTFFAASGDVGPVLNPSACSVFDAEFPSASPYIISVGGNAINKDTGDIHAWVNSSGGFSVYNEAFSFQKEHVQHYINTASSLPANANSAKYNTANRAYPDVSGFGALEPVLANGSYEPVGGTSGACPQFAGVVAMINAYRYQHGLGPLGALGQTLYGLKNGVGTDVTLGQNYATSRFGCYGQYLPGFLATEGWDPATGLGSPKWSTLVEGLGSIKGSSAGKKDHHKRRHHDKKHNKKDEEFLPLN